MLWYNRARGKQKKTSEVKKMKNGQLLFGVALEEKAIISIKRLFDKNIKSKGFSEEFKYRIFSSFGGSGQIFILLFGLNFSFLFHLIELL